MHPAYAARYRAQRRVTRPDYRRSAVLARWGHRCGYCNAPATHLDHITPLAAGGRDVLANVIPACASCNASKGTLSLAQWAAT
ncbi:HNH endonuclease [Streptomyces albidoflavus]